jgi:prepilin-type N-terminal cleavage/methylation domain-containing protein/prepilin-type processing-associated H-X9-DG protein
MLTISKAVKSKTFPLMPNGSKGSGFTLVEMLVVVAIIALLAAFAFPALRKSMDARNEAGCVSNLRNLISAWSLYCADNAGYSVPIVASDSKRLYSSWVASLVPYLGEGNIDKMICCPAAHKASAQGNRGGTFNAWQFTSASGRKFLGSYGISANWYTKMDSRYPDPGELETAKQQWWLRSMNALPDSVVFSDAAWVDFARGPTPTEASIQTGTTGWQMARHRNRGVNMAFTDGSVRFLTVGEAWASVRFSKVDKVPRPKDPIPPQYH